MLFVQNTQDKGNIFQDYFVDNADFNTFYKETTTSWDKIMSDLESMRTGTNTAGYDAKKAEYDAALAAKLRVFDPTPSGLEWLVF